jgi:hypothetical protein
MAAMDPVMDIGFEDAMDSDAEALADLRVVAMRESLERIGRFDPARARERLLSSFDAAATRHVVAGGLRVGFFVVRTRPGEMVLDCISIPATNAVGLVLLSWPRCFPMQIGRALMSESAR